MSELAVNGETGSVGSVLSFKDLVVNSECHRIVSAFPRTMGMSICTIENLLCRLLGASLQCTAQHVQVPFNTSWATLCVCVEGGGRVDSSVADPLAVRAVDGV